MIRCSRFLLLFLLAFAPLAFGSVEYWSLLTVEVVAAGALLVGVLGLQRASMPVRQVPGLVPLLLLVLLMALQLVPLPPAVVQLLSPNGWSAYQPIIRELGGAEWVPMSLHPRATLLELLRICSYGLVFILAVQLLRDRESLKQVLFFLVFLGAGIALLGILQQFSSGGLIYWFRPTPDGVPGGPWVYKNHYSAFLECLAPLALALFLFYKPRFEDDMPLRERVVVFFSSSRSSTHIFLGTSFVLIGTAVFVSLCRGGIATLLFSLALFGLLLRRKRRKSGTIAYWSVLGLIVLAVSWYGWQPVVDEFDAGFNPDGSIRESRLPLWADSLDMIGDFPVVGAGFGTYNDVYPSYKTIKTDLIFHHAHNEYIELLTDGGVIGFAFAAWFVLAILLHGRRMIGKRRDTFVILTGIGILVGIVGMLLHSSVDFVLHNGAVGLYFFFLCGLLVAVVNMRSDYGFNGNGNGLLPVASRSVRAALTLAGAFFLVVFVGIHGGILLAAHSYNGVRSIYVNRLLAPDIMARVVAAVDTAMTFDPLASRYPFRRGELAGYREGRAAALFYYTRAARLQPMEGAYLQRIGMTLPPDRKDDAIALIQEGYRRALNKDDLALGWVEWLLYNDERERAKAVLAERLATDRELVIKAGPILEHYHFSTDEVAQVLPESPVPWIRYGAYLERIGKDAEAGFFRERALGFIDNEERVSPHWFGQLYHYHNRMKQPDRALAVLREAVEVCPDYAPFRIWLGNYYKKENIIYRAREEYQRAVMLEPGNETYRKKLREVE